MDKSQTRVSDVSIQIAKFISKFTCYTLQQKTIDEIKESYTGDPGNTNGVEEDRK